MNNAPDTDRYEQLAAQLKEYQNEAAALRTGLAASIMSAQEMLFPLVCRRPRPKTSHYWPMFSPFWQSFEIFTEQMDRAERAFIDASRETAPVLDHSVIGVDFDELEETVESYRRFLGLRSEILLFLELIDTADRLLALPIPVARGRGIRIYRSLLQFQSITRAIRASFFSDLRKANIRPISLAAGSYPDPEHTRVIARLDTGTDDDVVISEQLNRGYMWHEKLLRKADVTVISRMENHE